MPYDIAFVSTPIKVIGIELLPINFGHIHLLLFEHYLNQTFREMPSEHHQNNSLQNRFVFYDLYALS